MAVIEATQKEKAQSYNLAKGGLTTLQRKQKYVIVLSTSRVAAAHWSYHKSGNLSQRSLLDIVKKGHLVEDSEYLETLVVAVPK